MRAFNFLPTKLMFVAFTFFLPPIPCTVIGEISLLPLWRENLVVIAAQTFPSLRVEVENAIRKVVNNSAFSSFTHTHTLNSADSDYAYKI